MDSSSFQVTFRNSQKRLHGQIILYEKQQSVALPYLAAKLFFPVVSWYIFVYISWYIFVHIFRCKVLPYLFV